VHKLVDAEPQIVIDDILKAAGRSAKDSAGMTLAVRSIQKLTNGDVHVQLSMERSLPVNAGGGIVIQGAGNVQINGNNIVIGSSTGAPTNAPRLLDADGQPFTLERAAANGLTINNNQMSQAMTLVYRPQPGQGPAARLVVPAQRLFVFDVPFTLRDIVLP